MDAQSEPSFNHLYQLNPALTHEQLADALNMCLLKAEALVAVATTLDVDAFVPVIINHYLWVLNDLIREAKWLHEKITGGWVNDQDNR